MGWFSAPEYWLSRLILERGIAAVYVLAFVAAARQFRALIGEHGLLPVPHYLARQSFGQAPSIFHVHYSDRFFATVAWSGAALSAAMVAGLADVVPLWAAVMLWLLLWVLYLSIVNVGQTWYSFGWESLLLETGFLATFLGNDRVAPPVLAIWLARLLLFRLEFGAGLIKLRGDSCWRDLTCLYYHHETQPMPGPLSWFFHHLPKPLHRVEVAGNHFAQLIVPFGLFAPQPVASIAGAIVVITQLWLVASGNFAWLNWLTILLGCSAIDASSAKAVFPIPAQPELAEAPRWFAALVIVFAVLTLVLSYWPVRNMISRRQRMNMSFNPFHLINTYGAFGSVGRTRREVVVEGTDEPDNHRADGVEGIRIQKQARSRAPSRRGNGRRITCDLIGSCGSPPSPRTTPTRGFAHLWCGSWRTIRRRCACSATIRSRMPRRVTCALSSTVTASPLRLNCVAITHGGIARWKAATCGPLH